MPPIIGWCAVVCCGTLVQNHFCTILTMKYIPILYIHLSMYNLKFPLPSLPIYPFLLFPRSLNQDFHFITQGKLPMKQTIILK